MIARCKTVLAYTAAILVIPLVLALFVGLGGWMRLFVNATGLTVSPWYTGGSVVVVVPHGAYETRIHRPVFDALMGERSTGFTQIDWSPKEALPRQIDEELDLDGDGRADVRVRWNVPANKVEVQALSPRVLGEEGHYELRQRLTLRIALRNPNKPGGN